MVESLDAVRQRTLVGDFDGRIQFLFESVDDLLLPCRGEQPLAVEVSLHAGDGVFRLPALDLFRIAILGRIDLGVPIPAVGLALDQGWPLAAASPCDGFLGYPVDRYNVVAVDGDAGKSVGLGLDADVRHLGLKLKIDALRPQVVLADEDDRQVVNAGEVQSLMPEAKRG